MGWTSPLTWVVAQIVTAANMNTHIRDNLNYLKGVNQVPTIESGLIIDNTGGDEYLKLPLLSTAEAGTVLAAEGKVAFDEQTHQVKIHNGTAVKAVISEADVDDTPVNGATTVPVSSNWAYDLKVILTTRGDVIRRGASDWERVALGPSGQYLSSNGTDVVWATAVGVSIATGSYAGDNAASRQVTTGFKCSRVIILTTSSAKRGEFIPGMGCYDTSANDNAVHATTYGALHATDGFTVNNNYFNITGQTYFYWAISE